jgi:Skp family chaperone for outer membrane proteins
VLEKVAEAQKFRTEAEKRLKQEKIEISLRTYQRIIEEIQRIAEARGLKLVLDYEADTLDAKVPEKRVESLSRRMILYERGLDITDEVLQALN